MGIEVNNTEEKTFITHPSKKVLTLFTVVWFVGISLSVMAATDLFTEPFFRSGQLAYYGFIIAPTAVVLKLYLNYFKNTVAK